MDRDSSTDTSSVYETEPEPRRRRVIFELAVESEPHISPRPEDNGAAFRRFVLNVSNPLDKRLLIISLFNGPIDANFRSLMVELNGGLQDVLREEAEADAAKQRATRPTPANEMETGSTTDTSSETEPSLNDSL
ncbi:uncharacterized protein LOC111598166 [Drosophila hydei]|uniref:Uncharacterized protein LOC111598166 n=1 Tax=Drosophila hydei TaxID=7224 RepID=A0A6J1LNF1_DROHY|nr:uncharacterized protein LOC111598166 [Drosophila hydei]